MNYNVGQNNPMFGRRHSPETIEKMRAKALGCNNSQWKGDKVEYQALHDWITNNFGQPPTCENCGETNLFGRKINWANKNGKYLRKRSDWKRLCVKCHRLLNNESYTFPTNGDSRLRSLRRCSTMQ